jgi:hypothetical protein
MKVKPAENKDESDVKISDKNGNYDGAIYYNKAGFNKEKTNYVDKLDEINVTPTGVSGKKYGDKTAPDIQEISIILPSLGNTINDIWNIVYGEGNPKRNLDI